MKERTVEHVWVQPFLDALAYRPVVTWAAEKVGIHPGTAYLYARQNEWFRERMAEAREIGVDRAEAAAYKRAVTGVQKGVWHNGVRVGSETVYSDPILLELLRANRRGQYGFKSEITGANGSPLIPDGGMVDDTAKAARLAALLNLAAARAAIDKTIDEFC